MSSENGFTDEEIHFVLHVIRNPHGWSDENVRDARLKAADIIEWLQRTKWISSAA